jgi:hypothetical protein
MGKEAQANSQDAQTVPGRSYQRGCGVKPQAAYLSIHHRAVLGPANPRPQREPLPSPHEEAGLDDKSKTR